MSHAVCGNSTQIQGLIYKKNLDPKYEFGRKPRTVEMSKVSTSDFLAVNVGVLQVTKSIHTYGCIAL